MKEINWKGKERVKVSSGINPAEAFGQLTEQQSFMDEEEAWEVLRAYLVVKQKIELAVFFKDQIVIGNVDEICDLKGAEWREKLIAFCEGLKVGNLGALLHRGKAGDYRKLGAKMTELYKQMRSDLKLIDESAIANCLKEKEAELGALRERVRILSTPCIPPEGFSSCEPGVICLDEKKDEFLHRHILKSGCFQLQKHVVVDIEDWIAARNEHEYLKQIAPKEPPIGIELIKGSSETASKTAMESEPCALCGTWIWVEGNPFKYCPECGRKL